MAFSQAFFELDGRRGGWCSEGMFDLIEIRLVVVYVLVAVCVMAIVALIRRLRALSLKEIWERLEVDRPLLAREVWERLEVALQELLPKDERVLREWQNSWERHGWRSSCSATTLAIEGSV